MTATFIFHRYFLISPGHFIIANDDKNAINFRRRITKSDKKQKSEQRVFDIKIRAIREKNKVFLIEKGDKEKAMNFRKVTEKFIN